MYFEQFFIDGLGCLSYLVGCETKGVAAVIDPDRDVRKYLDAARVHNLKITHIIETHLHADHVSGNQELAARTDAEIYLHELSEVAFTYQPLKDGDVISLGDLKIQAQHTPGHTPESITLLITDTNLSDQPRVALTGDTLLVGDAGRPDLVGEVAVRQLAGQLYDSLFTKLAPLPDHLLIYPGHGPGSLCGRSIGRARSTTLGRERGHNLAFASRNREAFVEFAMRNLPEQPGNHERIKTINRAGSFPLGKIVPCPLTTRQANQYVQQGAVVLDTRNRAAYLKKHIPGSANLRADDQLSTRAGNVLSPNVPLLLLLEDDKLNENIIYSLARVGFHNVVGYLSGGLDAWEADSLPVTRGDVDDILPTELHALETSGVCRTVIDVREPWEFAQGHVPGARSIPLGSLMTHINSLDPAGSVAVICESGNRSLSAAALLSLKRFRYVYNVLGGTSAWSDAKLPLAISSQLYTLEHPGGERLTR